MRKQSIKLINTWCFLIVVACSQQDIQAGNRSWATQIITAAEQGKSEAQKMLGVMYEKGFGIRESAESGFQWMYMAASQGDTSAQFLLGRLYATGNGIPQDDDIALALFHEAEVAELQRFYETPEYLVFGGGYEGAILAAKSGNSLAQTIVGKMYLTGAGGTQNDVEAVYWLKQSAEQVLGGAGAQAALAYMLEEGRGGLSKDKHEAMRLYLNVSEQMVQNILDALQYSIQMMQLYENKK